MILDGLQGSSNKKYCAFIFLFLSSEEGRDASPIQVKLALRGPFRE